jgi:hypothetical protein
MYHFIKLKHCYQYRQNILLSNINNQTIGLNSSAFKFYSCRVYYSFHPKLLDTFNKSFSPKLDDLFFIYPDLDLSLEIELNKWKEILPFSQDSKILADSDILGQILWVQAHSKEPTKA